MKKFLILFCMPIAGLDAWMKKDEAERKAAEDEMKGQWNEWMKTHASAVVETGGAGKNLRVNAAGADDARNDIMLYGIMQGESREAVGLALKDHPHLGIPDAWIEVMEMKTLPA